MRSNVATTYLPWLSSPCALYIGSILIAAQISCTAQEKPADVAEPYISPIITALYDGKQIVVTIANSHLSPKNTVTLTASEITVAVETSSARHRFEGAQILDNEFIVIGPGDRLIVPIQWQRMWGIPERLRLTIDHSSSGQTDHWAPIEKQVTCE